MWKQASDAPSSRGFTLIELLVVILVIVILIAVAAPSFLGQTYKAQDSMTKQSLALAYRAARTTTAETGVYPSPADLERGIALIEPGLNVISGVSCEDARGFGARIVVLSRYSSSSVVIFFSESDSGTVFRLIGPRKRAPTIDIPKACSPPPQPATGERSWAWFRDYAAG